MSADFCIPQNFRPIPIGIVGAGAIVKTAHLPAALRSPLVEVAAVVDRKLDNAAGLLKDYGLHCALASDLSEVIDRVAAVIIATPPGSHYALAQFALNHDVHVLLEKPMTVRSADALSLCELAERRSKVLAVGYYSRCHPSVVLMKRLIDEGFFGEILGFRLQHGSIGGWTPVTNYKLDLEQAGGGELMSNGTYFIDRLLYWFDAPRRFKYQDDSHGGPEANCKWQMQYDNAIGQFSGEIFLSATVNMKTRFVLDTTKYICEHIENRTQSVMLYPKNDARMRMELFSNTTAIDPEQDYFQEQLERFVGAINGWCTVPVDGRFGARSVQLIEDMYRNRSLLDESWLSHLMQDRREECVEK